MNKDVKFNFEGKNFIVVGASSGMGRQVATDLANSGARVLAVARNEERLNALKECSPVLIDIARLDVNKAEAESWDEIIGNFVEKHGKISGGVYTAGISGMTPLRTYENHLCHEIMDTSFFGMARFIQCCSKKKFAAESSSFVVFSSTAARWGNKGQFAYSAAKAAVQGAVRSIAKEICRSKHRINSISPGWVETDMSRKSVEEVGNIRPQESFAQYHLGIGQPKDVSGMVLFLLSDAARWITGTDVVVDGGSLLGTN